MRGPAKKGYTEKIHKAVHSIEHVNLAVFSTLFCDTRYPTKPQTVLLLDVINGNLQKAAVIGSFCPPTTKKRMIDLPSEKELTINFLHKSISQMINYRIL